MPAAPTLIVAVDIGATWIRTALADGRGNLHGKAQLPTPRDGTADEILAPLFAATDALLASRAPTAPQPTAIGVAAMGPIDARTGTLAGRPPNLGDGWRDLPLGPALSNHHNLPTTVGRDTNVAALGERFYGAARGREDFIYLTVSSGIGGAVVSDGHLLTGAHGFGGELGHMPVDLSGPPCGCGLHGCIEAIVSGTALARQAQRLQLGDDARDLLAAAAAGHPEATKVMDNARAAFAQFAVGLVNAFDPSAIVVGGAVAHAEGERLLAPARTAINDYALARARQDVHVLPAALGADNGLIGCLPLVREHS
ncbi:ROK family protein [Conexibacter woesei]|uniref:ROK family protein n=1 Tax=Conexibacter woesei TaxID=191495 RepID=UPI000401A7DD|nr:ROK family protein [Conexibacter woesei]